MNPSKELHLHCIGGLSEKEMINVLFVPTIIDNFMYC